MIRNGQFTYEGKNVYSVTSKLTPIADQTFKKENH